MKIGDLLVSYGAMDERDLERAMSPQRSSPPSSPSSPTIGEQLQRLGPVDSATLLRALSRQTGLSHVDLTHFTVPVEVLRTIRFETVCAQRVLPVALQGRTLILAMLNPEDVDAIAVAQLEAGMPVRPVLLSAVQFERALATFGSTGYGEAPLHLEAAPTIPPPADDLISMLRTAVD
ncbi:MAG: hypothetical protein ACHREM_18045, partial [Polyangiales bacterium]